MAIMDSPSHIPLAEQLRPNTLEDYLGQSHLIGDGAILRQAVLAGSIPSMILWGPPGVGKTTLAHILAKTLGRPYFTLSAVHSGVKDVREVIEKAGAASGSLLFIDEIHRFNKSQQDSLLGAVERGTITLIGATTENPSFEVISPLLSRCQVYILKPLDDNILLILLEKARIKMEAISGRKISFKETEAILRLSAGDARKLFNAVELVVHVLASRNQESIVVDNSNTLEVVQQNLAMYDKQGEMHYDIISAFIKSMRGSDPNAAVYYLARMLQGGEDIKFIARRMVILAAEDIGLANPNALLMAQTCFNAIHIIGMPEARIILSETAIYLASSPKSNSAYAAIEQAIQMVERSGDMPVPLHLRNAPTLLMKKSGYGKNYQYAHDYHGNFVAQEFLPQGMEGKTFYKPQANAREQEISKLLGQWWKGKYGYK